jgi:hypothetical protein
MENILSALWGRIYHPSQGAVEDEREAESFCREWVVPRPSPDIDDLMCIQELERRVPRW